MSYMSRQHKKNYMSALMNVFALTLAHIRMKWVFNLPMNETKHLPMISYHSKLNKNQCCLSLRGALIIYRTLQYCFIRYEMLLSV